MDNPFALAIIIAQQEALSKKLNDTDRQATRMKLIDALQSSGKYNPVQIKEFVRFLNKIIIVKNSKYNIIFDKHLEKLTGGAVTMGITETTLIVEVWAAKYPIMISGAELAVLFVL
jgi:pyoverdine/dityrosine biosynthesis protein Dit1